MNKAAFGVCLVSDTLTAPLHGVNVLSTGPSGLPAGGSAVSVTTVARSGLARGAVSTSFGTAFYPPDGGGVGAPGNVMGGCTGVTAGLPTNGSSTIPSLVVPTIATGSPGSVNLIPGDVDPRRPGMTIGNTVYSGFAGGVTRSSTPVVASPVVVRTR